MYKDNGMNMIDFHLFRRLLKDLTGIISITETIYTDNDCIDISKAKNHSILVQLDENNAMIYSQYDIDCPNTTDHTGLFEDFQAKALDLRGLNTSNVTDMSYMFADSEAISINLSTFCTKHTEYMSYMFANSKATTLNLSNFSAESVICSRGMFFGSETKRLYLPNFDTSNITNMDYMFTDSQANTVCCKSQYDIERMKETCGCSATGFEVIERKELL